MYSLFLPLTISLQLVASYSKCLPYLLVFTSLLELHSYRSFCKRDLYQRDFKDLAGVGLAVLKKIIIF